MQRPTTEQQDRLHQDFTAALDLLDKENREPDRWEEECLSYALGAMACGLYLAAEVELAAFARPLAERSLEEIAVLEKKPSRFFINNPAHLYTLLREVGQCWPIDANQIATDFLKNTNLLNFGKICS